MKIEVSPSLNIYDKFSYEYRGNPEDISKGTRVLVPIGNRVTSGWVIRKKSDYSGRVKPVIGIVRDTYRPSEKLIEFILRVSDEFFVSAGKLLDNSLSPSMKPLKNLLTEYGGKIVSINSISSDRLKKISSDREIDLFYKKPSPEGQFFQSSNKSNEIGIEKNRKLVLSYDGSSFYSSFCKSINGIDRSVLIILPAQVQSLRNKFLLKRFLLYNSKQKLSEREKLWLKIVSTGRIFVAGSETSLFLPFFDLNSIVLERPGSSSYWNNPYSRIDIPRVARIRADVFGINLIERDITYTTENFKNRKYIEIIDNRDRGDIHVVSDGIKPGEKTIPSKFIDAILSKFNTGEKILILTGKKELFEMLFCPKCKKIINCPNCHGTLRVSDDFTASCSVCSLKDKKIISCNICDTQLTLVKNISVQSLKTILDENIGKGKTRTVFPTEKKLDFEKVKKWKENIIISTPGIVNFLENCSFNSVFFLKPESYFNLNKYNGSELIFSSIWNIKSLVARGGEISVISVFNFHYLFKYINNEKEYFERELKYRYFFLLPPYTNLYGIEIRAKDIRILGRKMRKIYLHSNKVLMIKKNYIVSRKRLRGYYRGFMELHASGQQIIDSKILSESNVLIKNIII